MKRLTAALLIGSVLCTAGLASAQAPPRPEPDAPADSGAPLQLFYQGRELMAQHRYAEACAVFERAEKVHATIGVLLNLADCYEQSGRTASAWSKFQEVNQMAQRANDSRANFARDRSAALEARLVKLTIDATSLTRIAGAEVHLDGRRIEATQLQTGIAVDPGRHTADVQAPMKQPWSVTIEVAASMTIAVPELNDARPQATEQPTAVLTTARPAAPEEGPIVEPQGSLPPGRVWALVAGGTGVVGIGIGSVFGAISLSKHNDAANHCMNRDNPCDGQGVRSGNDAQWAGNVSTVAFVAGFAALTGGVVLWLTAPRRGAPQLAIIPIAVPQAGSLSVRGMW